MKALDEREFKEWLAVQPSGKSVLVKLHKDAVWLPDTERQFDVSLWPVMPNAMLGSAIKCGLLMSDAMHSSKCCTVTVA